MRSDSWTGTNKPAGRVPEPIRSRLSGIRIGEVTFMAANPWGMISLLKKKKASSRGESAFEAAAYDPFTDTYAAVRFISVSGLPVIPP